MKISRSVLGALLSAGALTLSVPPAQANDNRTDDGRSGKTRSESHSSDRDSYGSGDSRGTGRSASDRNTRSGSDSRTMDRDSRGGSGSSSGTSGSGTDGRTMDRDSRGGAGDTRGTGREPRSSNDSRGSDADSRSTSDRVSDQALETKVKTALIGDSKVKARKIEVEVRNGVVDLSGTVHSQSEAEAAISTARRVAGVSTVNSRLTVGANP